MYVRVCVFARLRFFHAVRKQRLRWKGKKKAEPWKNPKKNIGCSKEKEKEEQSCTLSLAVVVSLPRRSSLNRLLRINRTPLIGFLLARTMHACPNVEIETCLRHITRHITRTSFLFFFPWNNRFFSFDSSEMTSCIVVEREREGKRFVNWTEISLFRKFLLELSSYRIIS